MSELNPNHPTTARLHDHWHKICAMLLLKLAGPDAVVGRDPIHTVVGLADIKRMPNSMTIAVKELPDGLHIMLLTAEQGDILARQEGGLPH